ncbi:8530_t:CDS:2 [Funneliformis mosseae]|uniref:8530_t:CDS:1 n=1 Tax=Funneliformis mosseae TaxID=27381 RepID=A0A9N8V3Y6_FUNMO|nr:8530_t:CDS:2 [Funneliformis mosseae]
MGNLMTKSRKERNRSSISPSGTVSTINNCNKNVKCNNKGFYRFINGRKYFDMDGSSYALPVDDEECDRLQIQHFLFRHVWQRNFSSPVKQMLENGCKVLDVGCGPGTWLLDMAAEYGQSRFIGFDMVATFPSEIKPHNLSFIQANLLDGLPFKDNEFDFVYMQNCSMCFTETQWKEKVIPEMMRVTKKDGWVEFMEIAPEVINMPKKLIPLHDAFINHGRLNNLNFEITNHLDNYLRTYSSNRLTDFQKETCQLHHHEKMDSTDSINMAGRISKEIVISFYHAISPMLIPALGVTQKEYDEIVDSISGELEKNKSFNNLYRYYARKGC